MHIDWTQVIIALIAGLVVIAKDYIGRNKVPARAAEAMRDSVPTEIAMKMADLQPPPAVTK